MNKPFKTINEQIEILNSRGVITDEETAGILRREGYYSIVNGYKGLFLHHSKDGQESYKHGVTFNEIYRLFTFDRSLRMILFKYIAIAESALKTITAYKFAEAHKSDHSDYLKPGSYRVDGGYPGLVQIFIGDIKKILGQTPDAPTHRPKPYIKHYMDKYGQVPIWVLTNYLTIGQAVKFFEFQTEAIRWAIANEFTRHHQMEAQTSKKIKPTELARTFAHIKDIRNICAHDERLYCARVSPRSNITFTNAVTDLSLILPASKDIALRKDIIAEIISCSHDIKSITRPQLLKQMGARSIDDLAPFEN
ncbi:MAG: Abi family protein [Coriobacteriia bacterium]|nr:Abi family protein [Coriobacteriia bacterium]